MRVTQRTHGSHSMVVASLLMLTTAAHIPPTKLDIVKPVPMVPIAGDGVTIHRFSSTPTARGRMAEHVGEPCTPGLVTPGTPVQTTIQQKGAACSCR